MEQRQQQQHHQAIQFAAIQERVHEGAALIAKNQLRGAFRLYKNVVGVILESTTTTQNEGSSLSPVIPSPPSAVFRPLLDDTPSQALCFASNASFFRFPFTLVIPGSSHHQRGPNDHVHAACGAVSLFNMGLCAHLEALRGKQDNGSTFQTACGLYGRACSILHHLVSASVTGRSEEEGQADPTMTAQPPPPSGTLFLFMATCTNLAMCHYNLGNLHSYNQYLGLLRELLSYPIEEEKSSSHKDDNDRDDASLRGFFMTLSAVNAQCIAAPTA